MNRYIYHRDDVRNILRGVEEAGRALAAEQPDVEFVRGYATALRLVATAFGFVTLTAAAPGIRRGFGHVTPERLAGGD